MGRERLNSATGEASNSASREPLVSRADVVDTLSLYCSTAANYVVPLLVLPFLARRLGPLGLGQATAGFALAASIAMVIDYGFPFTGARLIAQNRDSSESVDEIVCSIQSAKFTIASAVMFLCLLTWPLWIKHADPAEKLVWLLGALSGLGRGLVPLYFFQGMNRLTVPAMLTGALRSLAMIFAAFLVKSPRGAGIFVGCDAFASWLNVLILTWYMHRSVAWRWAPWSRSIESIKHSAALFLFTLLANTSSSLGLVMAKSLVPYAELGFYGGADRITRATGSMFGPIGQVVYPKLSRLVHTRSAEAKIAARWTFILNSCVGAVLFLIVFLGARPFVTVVLGRAYLGAVTVLKILSFQLLATATSRALGVQWMLPLGLDRLTTALVAASGGTYFVLLIALAPHFGACGIAFAFVAAESQLSLSMVLSLHRLGLGWWQTAEVTADCG